ncbi:diguanylate cyclase [Acetobacter papayae]|uniref:sensor domain-containing diguanylate cyclase n=2 Tax=Acetobacter papayae TaxID=1076592 RepID=UPI0039EA455E
MQAARPDKSTVIFKVVLGLLLYFITSALVIRFTTDGRSHASIWPGNGIILALLLNRGLTLRKRVLCLTFLTDILAKSVVWQWTPWFCATAFLNVAEIALVAAFARFYTSHGKPFSTARTVLNFALIAGLAVPFVISIPGAFVTSIAHHTSFSLSFWEWLFSTSFGLLIFTPMFTSLFGGQFMHDLTENGSYPLWKIGIVLLCQAILAVLVFSQSAYPLLFIPAEALIISPMLIGEAGATLSFMIITITGLAFTIDGKGPTSLIHTDHFKREVLLQVYLFILLLTERPVSSILMSKRALIKRLTAREQMLALAMINATDSILSFDRDWICRWAGGASLSLLGVANENLPTQRLCNILETNNREVVTLMETFFSGDQYAAILEIAAPHTQDTTIELNFRKVFDAGTVAGAIVTIHDVTQRKLKEDDIARQSESDPMTGLLNRAGFQRRINALINAEHADFSLAYIDADHFKDINDHYGHEAGDTVLKTIAARISHQTRASDIVSRFGGDEFVLAITKNQKDAAATLDRIVHAIHDEPIALDTGETVQISISCGVAPYSVGVSVESLLRQADSALYEAKKAGRNRTCEVSSVIVSPQTPAT